MGTYAIAHNRKYGMNVDTKYDKKQRIRQSDTSTERPECETRAK